MAFMISARRQPVEVGRRRRHLKALNTLKLRQDS
jgi:hypothetical protein